MNLFGCQNNWLEISIITWVGPLVSFTHFLLAATRVSLCFKRPRHFFPRIVCVLFSKPMYLPCFLLLCVVLLVRPDVGVPVGGMTVSALGTLVQACVCNGLIGAVTHWQASGSNVPSQFGVASIPVAGSSAEVYLPGRSSGCSQPQNPLAHRVAKERKPGRKLARSCSEWKLSLNSLYAETERISRSSPVKVRVLRWIKKH